MILNKSTPAKPVQDVDGVAGLGGVVVLQLAQALGEGGRRQQLLVVGVVQTLLRPERDLTLNLLGGTFIICSCSISASTSN